MEKRYPEIQYLSILDDILKYGVKKSNRTGIDTYSLFNTVWDSGELLKIGRFPLMTTRKTYFKGALVELFWILGILQKQDPICHTDRNNVAYLKRAGCDYWDKWADENGDLGPVYGAQLTEWKYDYKAELSYDKNDNTIYMYHKTMNQVDELVKKLRENPDDRRLVCTMWNPGELDEMALPPCHYCFECYSKPLLNGSRELSLRWVQRSCDMPLGVPYDITMYSLLLIILCKLTSHKPGTVYGLFGDSHIYENQVEGVKQMLKNEVYEAPNLVYTGPEHVNSLYDFKMEWFNITDYKYHKAVDLAVNV